MNILLSSFLFYLAFAISPVLAQQKSLDILYVGTFSERGSKGIYVFDFDRSAGKLIEIQTVENKKSPSFLEIHPNRKYLYAAYREGSSQEDENGTITSFMIDQLTGKLAKINEQSSMGSGPCHVSVDPQGRFVYVSNYGGGNLAVYPIHLDGSLGKPVDIIEHTGKSIDLNRQQEPHVHSAIPSENGRFVYVSDLGIDKIMIYKVEKSGKLSPTKMSSVESKPGSGPRHLTFHQNGKFAYSIEELSSTIAVYKVDSISGSLNYINRVDMLSPNFDFTGQNSAADIHISPDGKFVYASNRGQNNLAIFAIDSTNGHLTLVGHEASNGNRPRNFCIDKEGATVFIANRESDSISVFKRDPESGKISFTGEKANVPAAVCIKQLRLF